jgi:hypothetical protein
LQLHKSQLLRDRNSRRRCRRSRSTRLHKISIWLENNLDALVLVGVEHGVRAISLREWHRVCFCPREVDLALLDPLENLIPILLDPCLAAHHGETLLHECTNEEMVRVRVVVADDANATTFLAAHDHLIKNLWRVCFYAK